jgi:tRNA threonylcarbamoyladenosine modification (KEOPS) complex  Pcc1 subunit
MGTPRLADTVFQALRPEINVSQKAGVEGSITIKESVLTLCFETQSIARMRAVINSYLRWIVTIINTIEKNAEASLPNDNKTFLP